MPTKKRSISSEGRLSRRGLLLGPVGLLAAGRAPGAEAPRIERPEEGRLAFHAGERTLFEYRYSAARPKTYVHPFCAPDGTPLTQDGPADHVHHRGLMLAWSEVNGYDFWGEVNPAPHGRIEHVSFEKISTQAPAAVTDRLRWTAGGETLLVERRTIRALEGYHEAVALEWVSELAAAEKPVVIAAGKHVYNGLGIRFAASMDGGGVLNSEGTAAIEEANGEPARWCAYHGALSGGRRAAVAIFDHPSNPRHPSPFFVMNQPFGYLSAAPTFRGPFPRLEPGRSIRLRYAVMGLLGEPQADRIEELYKRWSAG